MQSTDYYVKKYGKPPREIIIYRGGIGPRDLNGVIQSEINKTVHKL